MRRGVCLRGHGWRSCYTMVEGRAHEDRESSDALPHMQSQEGWEIAVVTKGRGYYKGCAALCAPMGVSPFAQSLSRARMENRPSPRRYRQGSLAGQGMPSSPLVICRIALLRYFAASRFGSRFVSLGVGINNSFILRLISDCLSQLLCHATSSARLFSCGPNRNPPPRHVCQDYVDKLFHFMVPCLDRTTRMPANLSGTTRDRPL